MVRWGWSLIVTSVVRHPERQLLSSLLSVCHADDSHVVGQTSARASPELPLLRVAKPLGMEERPRGCPTWLWRSHPAWPFQLYFSYTMFVMEGSERLPWDTWHFHRFYLGQKHRYFLLLKPFTNLGVWGHTQKRGMHTGHLLKEISQYLIFLPETRSVCLVWWEGQHIIFCNDWF